MRGILFQTAVLFVSLRLPAGSMEPPPERRYDQAVWLSTHNAMNNRADGWKLPNQNKNLRGQFDDGVRAFMLDIHVQDGALVLRHGPDAARLLGFRPLAAGLAEIRGMLEADKDAILTLILENYAPPPRVAQAIREAGLEAFAHTQEAGKPWPEIKTMIAGGKRLVVLSDRAAGAPAWFHPVWDHAWETPFSARRPEDLKNVPNRGRQGNPLLILNHFCADPIPSPGLSAKVNEAAFLTERIAKARDAFGRGVNFIVVDFHDLGGPAGVVSALNAIPPDEVHR
jgi:hypothetical protein